MNIGQVTIGYSVLDGGLSTQLNKLPSVDVGQVFEKIFLQQLMKEVQLVPCIDSEANTTVSAWNEFMHHTFVNEIAKSQSLGFANLLMGNSGAVIGAASDK